MSSRGLILFIWSPKGKEGQNEKNELIPTRNYWVASVCRYKRLNQATRKYHFPIPFMDQMLERLA